VKDIAGYMVKRQDGLYGSRGSGYDYIMAGNGLFVEASNSFISARVQISDAKVRGLPELEPQLFLRNKRIPVRFIDLALSWMKARSEKEMYAAIAADGEFYKFTVPEQTGTGSSLKYEVPDEQIVMELHSHASMSAFFSPTDNKDEQGLKIYGVIGKLGKLCSEIRLRVGVYGYWQPVKFCDVIDFPDIRDSNWLRDRYTSNYDLSDEEADKLEEVVG
jgi:PRTRC genetic system protein A